MAAPTLPANATEAQALAYLNANFKNTYTNSVSTPYNGKNAAQIYAILKSKDATATPYQLAQATADLLLSSAIGGGIGTGATEGLTGINDFAQAASNGANYLPSLTNLLGALTAKNLWIRVAKVVIGGTLVIVGLSHMTGASNAVASTARKVPVVI